jgi:hypothetical protein
MHLGALLNSRATAPQISNTFLSHYRNQYPLEHELVSRLDLPRDFADLYA